MRREAPIAEMPPIEDALAAIPQEDPTGYRAIMRYDDIKRISRDAKTFSSAQGVVAGDVPEELREATLSFIAMDAPRHTKLRGLVSSAFTPRQVARIEEGIRLAAAEIVAEAAPHGRRRLRLADRQAAAAPDDLGHDRRARRRPRARGAAADTIVSVGDEEFLAGREPMAALGEAIWTLSQFASEMAAHREQHPGDDLMTALVQAEIDGERLTHAEISAWFVLLSVAGNDTTRHTTSHAMRALTLNPDQRALLGEDLEARLPVAVEEFVRWATPVLHFRRTVMSAVEMHGEVLEPGEKVVMFYLSGNRDERGDRRSLSLRRDARPELPPRLRRRWPALLPRRLARPDAAALDLRGAAHAAAGHRGGRARSTGRLVHSRREADGLQLAPPTLTGARAVPLAA